MFGASSADDPAAGGGGGFGSSLLGSDSTSELASSFFPASSAASGGGSGTKSGLAGRRKARSKQALRASSNTGSSVDTITASLLASSGSIELRIATDAPSLEAEPKEHRETREPSNAEGSRARAVQPATTVQPDQPQRMTHIVLGGRRGGWASFIRRLPHSTLVLTHFTITSAVDGATLCHHGSFPTPSPSFDASIAALLPLHTRVAVKDQVADFDQLLLSYCKFEAVHFSFELYMSQARRVPLLPLPRQTLLLLLLHPVLPLPLLLTPGKPAPALPRLARVRDASVQLTTTFSVSPSFRVPLAGGFNPTDERSREVVHRILSRETGDTEPQLKGEPFVLLLELVTDGSVPLPQSPLHMPDVLDLHRQRVLAASGYEFGSEPSGWDSAVPAFVAHCPPARLSSFALWYRSTSKRSAVAFEVQVVSDTDMQLRGFHVVRPTLQLQLHSGARREHLSVIRGPAQATYSTAGGERIAAVSTDITIGKLVQQTALVTVDGDPVNVMRMADILTTLAEKTASQTPEAGSSCTSIAPPPSAPCPPTTLRWTLDAVLARLSLLPSRPPASLSSGQPKQVKRTRDEESAASNQLPFNIVECKYSLSDHTISPSVLPALHARDVSPSTVFLVRSLSARVAGEPCRRARPRTR